MRNNYRVIFKIPNTFNHIFARINQEGLISILLSSLNIWPSPVQNPKENLVNNNFNKYSRNLYLFSFFKFFKFLRKTSVSLPIFNWSPLIKLWCAQRANYRRGTTKIRKTINLLEMHSAQFFSIKYTSRIFSMFFFLINSSKLTLIGKLLL